MVLPPVVGALVGLSEVITGGVTYVKPLDVVLPPQVVTSMVAAPAVPLGATAVICVLLTLVKLVAATPLNVTAVVFCSAVPVRVIVRPPGVGPLAGATPVMAGVAWEVYTRL
jgi:hypothetical protein